MEREEKHPNKTQDFVKKYWPVIAVAGAVGAAIWLTARYIKEKKHKDSDEFKALGQIEEEALASTDETSAILETGTQLTKIAGQEVVSAAKELSEHLDDPKAKSTLEVLDNIASMQKNKKS